MAQISFKLPVFEGPLDLLLHLIAKHKLNIYDIEISKLLEQYLLYMEQCSQQDYELAGEFLEMAARLIYIKTASLLPSPEEAESIKKELEGALIEYSLCKLAAAELAKRDLGDCIFVRRQMPVQIDPVYRHSHEAEVLRQAYLQIGAKPKPGNTAPLTDRIQAVVQQRVVSVISKVVYVLRRLYAEGTVRVDNLYEGMTDRSARVATFLAVLELTKTGRTRLSEDNTELSFCRQHQITKKYRIVSEHATEE
ncbi:segregation and condensation protein A [Ruminococcus sp.]|uniref:segregation and condensation protein A n=1 Tax=Ruminococcus sp. TaxID=41978 RepID=UPI003F01104F